MCGRGCRACRSHLDELLSGQWPQSHGQCEGRWKCWQNLSLVDVHCSQPGQSPASPSCYLTLWAQHESVLSGPQLPLRMEPEQARVDFRQEEEARGKMASLAPFVCSLVSTTVPNSATFGPWSVSTRVARGYTRGPEG